MVSIPQIISAISKLEGSKGALSLSGKQLRTLAQKDQHLMQVVDRMQDPVLDVAYKAKSNYNVAAFRLRDGKEAVANGAVSLQNPGTAESIIKYRLNVGENGKILSANGFADFGKQLDVKYRQAAEVNEDEAIKLLSRYSGIPDESLRKSIYGRMTPDTNKLQKLWKEFGHILSGAPKGAKIEKVTDIPELKTFDPAAFKKATVGADEALTKLRKLAKEDFSEFVKVRNEMGKYGFQPYFHPKTGEFKIMDGVKNMEEVGKKLKAQGLINDIPKANSGAIKQPDIKNIDDYIKQ